MQSEGVARRDNLGEGDQHINNTLCIIVTGKDLLYNTGSSIDYSALNPLYDESLKQWISVYVQLIAFAVCT